MIPPFVFAFIALAIGGLGYALFRSSDDDDKKERPDLPDDGGYTEVGDWRYFPPGYDGTPPPPAQDDDPTDDSDILPPNGNPPGDRGEADQPGKIKTDGKPLGPPGVETMFTPSAEARVKSAVEGDRGPLYTVKLERREQATREALQGSQVRTPTGVDTGNSLWGTPEQERDESNAWRMARAYIIAADLQRFLAGQATSLGAPLPPQSPIEAQDVFRCSVYRGLLVQDPTAQKPVMIRDVPSALRLWAPGVDQVALNLLTLTALPLWRPPAVTDDQARTIAEAIISGQLSGECPLPEPSADTQRRSEPETIQSRAEAAWSELDEFGQD